MRDDGRLRALWRDVAGPLPVRAPDLERLASRIGNDAALALRARATWLPSSTRWARVAVAAGLAVAAAAGIVIALAPPPPRPAATLIEAVSGREIPDGAWVIAAAIRTNQ
jgi:hypothetical protein